MQKYYFPDIAPRLELYGSRVELIGSRMELISTNTFQIWFTNNAMIFIVHNLTFHFQKDLLTNPQSVHYLIVSTQSHWLVNMH